MWCSRRIAFALSSTKAPVCIYTVLRQAMLDCASARKLCICLIKHQLEVLTAALRAVDEALGNTSLVQDLAAQGGKGSGRRGRGAKWLAQQGRELRMRVSAFVIVLMWCPIKVPVLLDDGMRVC